MLNHLGLVCPKPCRVAAVISGIQLLCCVTTNMVSEYGLMHNIVIQILLSCTLQPGPVDQPAEKLDRWKQNIAEIAAECPNVYVKCGGYQMVNSNMGLEKRPVPIGSEELCHKVLPIYQHVIRCFTPARCMFESNVCCQSPAPHRLFRKPGVVPRGCPFALA